jgi:hypothetical protein
VEFFTGFLIAGLVMVALWAGYSRMRRNQMIAFAETQAGRLQRFIDRAPFDAEPRFSLRQGEMVVYELSKASLAETRRGPRVSHRSANAFTFRFAPGFYYTAAGGKSVSDSVDEMSEIDTGRATFTNKRVIFVGEKQTREWDFSKLLGWEVASGGYIMMAVSNRQRMSGVCGSLNDLMAPVAFDLAQIVASDGFDAAKISAASGIYSANEQARIARKFTLYNPTAIGEREQSLDREMPRRFEELEKAGYVGWLDPGVPIPQSTAKPARNEESTKSESESRAPIGKVPEELEVVGEFFHPEAFEALRQLFGTDGDSEHIVEAELRCDPENPYSDSGMAVAVYVQNQHVGHIPELLAPAIFEMVEAKGGEVKLGARLWLDHKEARPGKSSVQIFVDSRLTG